jgi:hypothetical protein
MNVSAALHTSNINIKKCPIAALHCPLPCIFGVAVPVVIVGLVLIIGTILGPLKFTEFVSAREPLRLLVKPATTLLVHLASHCRIQEHRLFHSGRKNYGEGGGGGGQVGTLGRLEGRKEDLTADNGKFEREEVKESSAKRIRSPLICGRAEAGLALIDLQVRLGNAVWAETFVRTPVHNEF